MKSNIVYDFILILIPTSVAVVLFSDSYITPLYIDEIFKLNILYMNNLSEIIRLGNIVDTHPPLYHLIMYFFIKCVGLSKYIIRVKSTIYYLQYNFFLFSLCGRGKNLFYNLRVRIFNNHYNINTQSMDSFLCEVL